MSLTSPIEDFIKRKLRERGFHDIKGLAEITTIDEFKERAFAIQCRSRRQTLDDVALLRKKYEQPIIGEVPVVAGTSGANRRSHKCLTFL